MLIYTEKEEANHMNKIDVITALAGKKNLTEKQAMEIVNLMFKGFTNELKNGGRIEIRGFGSFSVREYKSYKGRNPSTGKAVEVKPKRLPFFKVGRELKKMVDS
jgi:Bacterial nucleoid DNA-binding protein